MVDLIKFSRKWSREQCIMAHDTKLRVAIYYDGHSQCIDPFQPKTARILAYFPCVTENVSKNYTARTDTNEGVLTIVVDRNQDLNKLLSGENKIILIDHDTKNIIYTASIRRWERFSPTDVEISFSLVALNITYQQVLTLANK